MRICVNPIRSLDAKGFGFAGATGKGALATQRTVQWNSPADRELMQAVLSGDAAAWRALVERFSPSVRGLCEQFCPDEQQDAAFQECWNQLGANDFARLRRYDGSSSLQRYLECVVVDLLALRLRDLLAADPARGWNAFLSVFRQDMNRLIHRVAGGPRQLNVLGVTPDDVAQEIALEMSAEGFRRLRSFDGRGSFVCFVRRVIRNLCLDWKRKQLGRRRLPVAIQRLGELEQQIYQWLYWSRWSEEEVRSSLRGRAEEIQIEKAIERVTAAVKAREAAAPDVTLPLEIDHPGRSAESDSPSPEQILLDSERDADREKLLDCLRSVLDELAEDEKLYIRFRFAQEPPLRPREIASLLGREERDIYRIRQRIFDFVRDNLAQFGYTTQQLEELLG
jgi:RNA polymerase primary sigma factor